MTSIYFCTFVHTYVSYVATNQPLFLFSYFTAILRHTLCYFIYINQNIYEHDRGTIESQPDHIDPTFLLLPSIIMSKTFAGFQPWRNLLFTTVREKSAFYYTIKEWLGKTGVRLTTNPAQ